MVCESTGDNRITEELAGKLSPTGRRAFEELCRLECDVSFLGFMFAFLATDEWRRDKPGKPSGGGRTIPLHALDRWQTATGGLNLDDLRAIARRAVQLAKDITKLKDTPAVRELISAHTIRRGDLLYPTPLEDSTWRLQGLIRLPEIIKELCSRKSPDRTEIRVLIAQHIHDKTGDWHDRLRADILLDVLPHSAAHPISAKSESQWRKRHCIVGAAGSS